MEDHTTTTIEDARNYINSQIKRGKAAKCPACTQTVKIYKRKIYTTMATSLINLYKLSPTLSYHHISEIEANRNTGGGGDFAKLVYWGLVQEAPKEMEITGKRTSGFWKITEMGKAFVEDRLKVPEYMHVYNKRLLRTTGDRVGIRDVLGEGFDYKGLMSQ